MITTFSFYSGVSLQPPQAGPVAAAGAGGGAPPPGRGFQFTCTEDFVYNDLDIQDLLRELQENAPPDFEATSVLPCIYPGKNAHRYLVVYRSRNIRRCEEIQHVWYEMNAYKPQNSVVGTIAVVPQGFMVEYSRFCRCQRRSHRRRRRWIQPLIQPTWEDSQKNSTKKNCPSQCDM